MSTDDGPPWFYNVRTREVEGRSGEKAANRLGPFASREEAADALNRVAARNEAWDEADEHDQDEDR